MHLTPITNGRNHAIHKGFIKVLLFFFIFISFSLFFLFFSLFFLYFFFIFLYFLCFSLSIDPDNTLGNL